MGLLDSGSTGSDDNDITSYIARKCIARTGVVTTNTFVCKSKVTCTPLSCTNTSQCIKLDKIKLASKDKEIILRDITIKVMETLGSEDVDIIIGYNEMLEYDLAEEFRRFLGNQRTKDLRRHISVMSNHLGAQKESSLHRQCCTVI